MGRILRRACSRLTGWLADRRLPRPLRPAFYRAFARWTGADLSQVRLPLAQFPSLAQFFVRELQPGARPFPQDPAAIGSPVEGTVQTHGAIERGRLLQAKGRDYALAELLGDEQAARALEGGCSWTIYLSPRDYHRIHAPESCRLARARWITGDLLPVAPWMLARRAVLEVNERCVLSLETVRGTLWLVLVGALNVGRLRVVGVEPCYQGWTEPGLAFARGAELARFELGSTIVLLAPAGLAQALPELAPGQPLRLGQPIGRWVR